MPSGKSTQLFLALAVVFLLAIFTQPIQAQLVGCDAVHCPVVPQNSFAASCAIDDNVYIQMGIANFSSALSPDPLTWTVGIEAPFLYADDTLYTIKYGFYLGAPPSLNLPASTTVMGCAIFFEGISSSLTFPGQNEYSIGTCSDALSDACVTDLLSETNANILKLPQGSGDVCKALELSIKNNAPKSCAMAKNQSWGTITAKNITGTSASPPIQLGDCTPTFNKSYSVSYVEAFNDTMNPQQGSETFGYGITPIMTVFSPLASTPENTTSDDQPILSLSQPELHLNCLKIVELQINDPPIGQGQSSRLSARLLPVSLVVLIAYALATIIM